MARQPAICCPGRVRGASPNNSTAAHRLPLAIIDCAGQTLIGGNTESHFEFRPVSCMPREIARQILIGFHFLRNYDSLGDGPTVPRMKLQQRVNTNRNTSDYAKNQEK